LGIFVTSFRFIYAENIPFEDNLPTIFTWWFNPWYYSNTHFKFWGNNFVGIVFWQADEQLTIPQNITINGWLQSINCFTHLRGIYYNNQRWRRIWPLDTGNLQTLQSSPYTTWYSSMTMTGWFYTNCTWVLWYTPQSNDIYGQIDHTLWTQTGFRMIAWVSYNFTGNAISGSAFDHTLKISTWWVHTWFMFDTNGGIAALDMNVPWCQSFTSSPTLSPIIINQWNNMSFTCNWSSASGYILSIWYSWATAPFTNIYSLIWENSQTRITGSALATGDYFATCTILGAGYSGGPQCWNQIYFHVGWTTTDTCNPNFQWEISFASLNGSTVINPSLATYYTNKTGIIMQLAATEPTHFVVSGDFLWTPWANDYIGNSIYTPIPNPISLANINVFNYFISTYTTWACNYIDANKRVYVDTLAPTTPTIISPINGADICPSTPLTVTRTPSTDSGAQLSHYRYEIYNNSWTTTGMMLSGTSNTTGATINPAILPFGTYYMKLLAIDNVGNIAASNTVSFVTSSQYCTTTGVLIVTPVIWLRNVELDKVYRSDPIWILWLTWPTLITISKWMLFINNGTGVWTTGIVTSNDTLYVEMISSNKYDTTVVSDINISWLTGKFSLTTKKNGCILSAAEKLTIENIYQDLKAQYNNDLTKLSQFLNTFQSMVADEAELSKSCTLDYLLSLIEDDFGNNWGIDTSNHITPNCKEYSIGYDISQKAYYAPEMANRYYFINRESLIRHLDYYNPGDCHINTYGNNFRTPNDADPMEHIAPNGKIYHLIGQYGWFSASEFVAPKYFDSMDTIIRYIDFKNPAKEIWKHTIDTSFTPIVFAAPNGREYKIYKTDRWFMSYKLMKVKYYDSLSSLKSHINVNNPSKR